MNYMKQFYWFWLLVYQFAIYCFFRIFSFDELQPGLPSIPRLKNTAPVFGNLPKFNLLRFSSLKFVDLTKDFYNSENNEYFGALPSHRNKINEMKMNRALDNYSKTFRNKIIDIPDIDKRLEKGLRDILSFSSTSFNSSRK